MSNTITATVESAQRPSNSTGFVGLNDEQMDELGVARQDTVRIEGATTGPATVRKAPDSSGLDTVILDWLARNNAGAPTGTDVAITTTGDLRVASAVEFSSLNTHLDEKEAAELLADYPPTSDFLCPDIILGVPSKAIGAGQNRSALFRVAELTPEEPVRINGATDVSVEDHEMISRPRGILSPADRLYLTHRRHIDEHPTTTPDTPPNAGEPEDKRLRQRVTTALTDFSLLLRHLPDDHVEQVFDEADHELRSTVQDALVFLLIGLQAADDDIELRLREAISHAAFTNDQYASVELDILTEDFPPGEVLLERLQKDGFDGFVRPTTMDRLFQDESIDPEDLAAAFEQACPDDENPPDADTCRLWQLVASRQERQLPSATLLNVEVSSEPQFNADT